LLLGLVTLMWSVATGLRSAASMTKRFHTFVRNRIVRQFKASPPAAKDTVANKSAEVDHSAQCTRSAPTAPDAREPLTR
jgi:hypothetical protein